MNVKACKQRGAILLTTLIMLSVLAMVVLSQMQILMMYYHLLNQFTEKHQAFYQLENVANALAKKKLTENQHCRVSAKKPDEIIALLKNKQACSLIHNKQSYFYLIEELGIFPCLQMNINKKAYSSQHLRVTVFTEKPSPGFIQLRFAHSARMVACKEKELHQIPVGLLSWRYLP